MLQQNIYKTTDIAETDGVANVRVSGTQSGARQNKRVATASWFPTFETFEPFFTLAFPFFFRGKVNKGAQGSIQREK